MLKWNKQQIKKSKSENGSLVVLSFVIWSDWSHWLHHRDESMHSMHSVDYMYTIIDRSCLLRVRFEYFAFTYSHMNTHNAHISFVRQSSQNPWMVEKKHTIYAIQSDFLSFLNHLFRAKEPYPLKDTHKLTAGQKRERERVREKEGVGERAKKGAHLIFLLI